MGGGAPMGMGMGVSDAKAQDFRGSIARFSTRLRPERWLIVLVLVLASTSVFLAVLGPKLLGNATNVIFDGVVGKQIPAGLTQDQAVAALEASGSTDQAHMLAAMTVTPGQGVDFTALAQVLALVVVVYVLSSVLSWAQNYLMAGVTQRTMYRLREDTDTKLGRLPLQVLRLRVPRRRPQSRHQRHRQHRQHPAADAHPADHVGADGHRRARDDVLDQPPARGHLPADRPALLLGHDAHREALPAALRGAVEVDRASSTATSRRRTPGTTW